MTAVKTVESQMGRQTQRGRFQFSLLTLLLLALLAGAGMTLWLHWQPWYLECTLTPEQNHKSWDNNIIAASFSPDSARIVVTHSDRTVNIWDIGNRTTTLIAMDEKIYPDAMKPAIMTPDQQYIVTYGKTERLVAMGMTTQVWNSRTGKLVSHLAYKDSDEVLNFPSQDFGGNFGLEKRRVGFPQTELVKISAESTKAATLDNDEHVRVWSLPDGALIAEWKPAPPDPDYDRESWLAPFSRERPLNIYFINDQAVVVSEFDNGNDRVLKLRAVQSASEVNIPEPKDVDRFQTAASPDGLRLLKWNRNPPTLYLWDTFSGKLLISSKRAKSETINLSCVRAVFLGDGRVLASLYSGAATERGDLWLWNPDANSSLAIASGGYSGYDEAFASPDGRRIVTRKAVTQIDDHLDHMRMWDATNGMPLFDFTTPIGIRLDRPQPRDPSIEFSPDGGHFLSYSEISPTVQIWHRRRPEYAWGIVALPEFWIVAALGIALVWSMTRGWRSRRASPSGSVPSQ